MNVTVETLAPCKKLMRVEVDIQKVDETFDSVTKDFQRAAALPGFRPGKAPKERAAPSLRLAKGAPNNLRKPHQRFVLSSFSFICVLGNSLTLLQLSVSVNLSSWIHSSLGTRALLSTVKLSRMMTSKTSSQYHHFR